MRDRVSSVLDKGTRDKKETNKSDNKDVHREHRDNDKDKVLFVCKCGL